LKTRRYKQTFPFRAKCGNFSPALRIACGRRTHENICANASALPRGAAGVALAKDKPAQEKPAVTPENPLSTWNKMAYTRVKGILARSAEKMPEENYSFKPVDTVRSYGQIIGHLADAQ